MVIETGFNAWRKEVLAYDFPSGGFSDLVYTFNIFF